MAILPKIIVKKINLKKDFMGFSELLQEMVRINASDLHMKVGRPPCFRKDGALRVSNHASLTGNDTLSLAKQIMPDRLRADFDVHSEIDFAFNFKDVGRFRVNIYRQRGFVGMSLRLVKTEITNISALNLPNVIEKLSEESRGLVLVTGTTGSGKSTTLAGMIDHINHSRGEHIVTIEDPIEFVHIDDKCLIDQREIGIDTASYEEALRNVVRQDPDIVLIGEMRDLATVRAALTAAELGSLVFSTLHTVDAAETINRIIDFFPPYQQEQIRLMLASTLKGIVSQRLLPKLGGGLVPAVEVLTATANIRELILENKISHIKEAIEQGSYYGMQSFEQSLVELYQNKHVALDDAVAMAHNAHDFKLKLRQLGIEASTLTQEMSSLEKDIVTNR